MCAAAETGSDIPASDEKAFENCQLPNRGETCVAVESGPDTGGANGRGIEPSVLDQQIRDRSVSSPSVARADSRTPMGSKGKRPVLKC